ncbi:MAG TPA: tetratricopeptide repeat protein [Roseimicrobium sp.]|nr:tetratricopeptide repeat protein [Roseimicrobium sp.]
MVVLLFVATILGAAQSGDVAQDFEKANALYEKGQYAEAAAAYQKLADSGSSSAALHFNLGNARFKAGQRGLAILSYRTAATLDPRDKDIKANLAFARTIINGGAELPPAPGKVLLRALSVDEWTGMAVALLWTTSILFVVAQLQPQRVRTFQRWIWVGGVLATTLGGVAFAALKDRTGRSDGVITATEVVVRYGPLEESQSRFTLRDGSEVVVEDRKDSWIKIRDINERVGWVKSDTLRVVSK